MNLKPTGLKRIFQVFYYILCKRHFYAVTAPLRALPDFLVIGVGRGGTTSCFHYLSQHPSIIGSAYDEIGFFDENFHLGLNWYRSMFPTKSLKRKTAKKFGKCLTYDVTPSYIWKPWVARRVKELFPGIKLIAILRNPVDKAYSHYHLSIRYNKEKLTFEEAVMRDMKTFSDLVNSDSKINDDYFKNQIKNSYLGRGFYAQQLETWFELFDRKQILILTSEELSTETNKTMNKIFQFLGLPDYNISDTVKRNTANYTNMKTDTRKKLITFFSKYNQDLFKLLNEEFVWNK
jgi:hypothetical protein